MGVANDTLNNKYEEELMNKLTDTYTLKNGVEIPCVGFGTWQTPSGDTTVMAVKAAIEAGYRHIDTAAVYRNEASVGQAIRESGVDRKDLFVTSKLWNSKRGYDKTKAAFERTLQELQMDYLDLFLIHWPAAEHLFSDWEEINRSTWKAMTELYKEGKIRAIGVSNFLSHHLVALMDEEIPPMIDQIEFHPGYMQKETVEFCKKNDIIVEAWSPLGSGRVLNDPRLMEIAAKYDKSVAQLCIRWCLQNETLPLPKSVTPSRIVENAQVFDFTISEEDMTEIISMPDFGFSDMHPDRNDF